LPSYASGVREQTPLSGFFFVNSGGVGSDAVVKVKQDAWELRFPTYRKWLKAFPDL